MAKKRIQLADRSGNSAYTGDLKLDPDFFETIDDGKALAKHKDGSIELSGIRIHRIGLEFVGNVSEEQYQMFGETLLQIDTAYQWIVGDYLAYGVDNNYGMAQEFSQALGRDEATIHNWTYVCRNVEFSRRRENLSFKHHYLVSSLSIAEQAKWLEIADENNWSASRLKKEIDLSNNKSIPATANEPIYKRWAEQSNERISKALAKYRTEKDRRKRNAWKRYIQEEVERWQHALNEIESE